MRVTALPAALTLWRLVMERHAHSAFSGEGARLHGGRWNKKGDAAVYTAATRSLSILEMLVQADPLPHYTVFSATLPPHLPVSMLEEQDLPPDWRAVPAPDSTQSLGSVWLRSCAACVLQVPSVVVPDECTYLLNPAHPDFSRIRISAGETLALEQRLLRQ